MQRRNLTALLLLLVVVGAAGTACGYSAPAEGEGDEPAKVEAVAALPPTPMPANAAEAAFAAIRAGETGYCPAPWIAELREAAAAELSQTRGVPVGPGRVLVANGAKPFLFFGVLATCEPGDEVISNTLNQARHNKGKTIGVHPVPRWHHWPQRWLAPGSILPPAPTDANLNR